MSYGLSFMPGADDGTGTNQQNGPQRPAGTPVQSAIKLLSLRLPSVVGANAISPQALLQSPGSAGVGGPGGMGGESLIEWLKKLLQQSQAQTPPQAQQAMAAPSMSGNGGDSFSDSLSREREMNRPSMPGGGGGVPTGGGGNAPQSPPSIPLPRVTPGEDERAGPASDLAPSAPVNPWSAPNRNPRLADKYGFDMETGNPFDL